MLLGYDNFNKDIIINENLLKAGKYGFFTIPNKDRVDYNFI